MHTNLTSKVWFRLTIAGALIAILAASTTAVIANRAQESQTAASDIAKFKKSTLGSRVVFIGDSYTAGAGATATSKMFARIVSDSEGWHSDNLGRGGTGYDISISNPTIAHKACGYSMCPNYSGMISAAKRLSPNIVFISGGRNDASVDPDHEEAEVNSFFRNLRKALPKAQVIATSSIWDSRNAPSSLGQINADIRAAVASVHGRYIDLGEPLQGHPRWIISDNVHPNDSGHAAIAHAILAHL